MRFKDAVWATSDPPRRSAAARHSAGASMSAGGQSETLNHVCDGDSFRRKRASPVPHVGVTEQSAVPAPGAEQLGGLQIDG
jgi:hypothetical protein